MHILDAHGAEYVPVVRALFEEYAAGLEVDLDFQGFERELAELPGETRRPAADSSSTWIPSRPAVSPCVRLSPAFAR